MSAVLVVLVMVSCTPDLLHCEDQETYGLVWETMGSCQAERAGIHANVQGRKANTGRVVMTKCRYALDETEELRNLIAARTARAF